MDYIEIIIVAIVQGATELFPVSSLGHAVILQGWLGWARDPAFLTYLILLHLGTALALLIYFWRDWVGLLAAFGSYERPETMRARRLISLIIIATLPAVVIGFPVRHSGLADQLFGNPKVGAFFLIANAALLYFGDRPPRAPQNDLARMTWQQALLIGFMQCLALLPGISRSGAVIVGGLLIGLSDAEAAHFTFLLATPIIGAAGVLEIPKLFASPALSLGPMLAGTVLSALIAYASTAFLMRYFRGHQLNALRPFALYCLAVGAISLVYFLV